MSKKISWPRAFLPSHRVCRAALRRPVWVAVLSCFLLAGFAVPSGHCAGPKEPLAQAKSLFDQGRDQDAAAVLAEALKRDPADERLLALVGRVRQRLGDVPGAEEAYRLALKVNPADTITRMRLDMLTDVAPKPAAKARPEPKRSRPPSNLERDALYELAKATDKPDKLGCGASVPILYPLPGPEGPGGDPGLSLALAVRGHLLLSGAGVVMARRGPYAVRPAERAALADISGADLFVALTVTESAGGKPSVEVLTPDYAARSAGQAANAGGPGPRAIEVAAGSLWRGDAAALSRKLGEVVASQLGVTAKPAADPAIFGATGLPCVLIAVAVAPGQDGARYLDKLASALARALAGEARPCP